MTIKNKHQWGHIFNQPKNCQQHTRIADKLRCEHLTTQREKMIDKVVPEQFQKTLANIERKEEVKWKHRTIQARLKKPHGQVTYVVQTDRTTVVGQEIVNVIQQFNSIHFQQTYTNGASAVSVSPFANGLRPFWTPEQVVSRNMEEMLSGMFDKNQIQPHKITYKNKLHRAHTLIDKIGAPISPANYNKYWTNMKESTALIPSGRHICMHKATVTSLEDPGATINQKRRASLIFHHCRRPHTLPSMFVRHCATRLCAKRGT